MAALNPSVRPSSHLHRTTGLGAEEFSIYILNSRNFGKSMRKITLTYKLKRIMGNLMKTLHTHTHTHIYIYIYIES
jgi:hypothetical protein